MARVRFSPVSSVTLHYSWMIASAVPSSTARYSVSAFLTGYDIFLWMRCNPDHHGLAFAKTGSIKMHHFAFEVVDFSYLAKQAEHLMQNGYALLYGPGRHGPGQNQFEYFRDPEKNLIEFMCDMQQIWDDASYEPRVWNSKELWVNLWGPDPPEGFV